MTQVKIIFSKNEVEKISNPSMPANIKCLKLKISTTDDLSKISEKIPPSSSLNKISIAFFDGAGTDIYNELLDDSKNSFELSWEKEKTNFWVFKSEEKESEEAKNADIKFFPVSKNLEISFKPKLSGVVKITSTSQTPPNKDQPNDKGKDKNSELDKQIAELRSRIETLEREKKQIPNNADGYQQRKGEIEQELSEANRKLKEKEKEKEKQEKSPKKNEFPTALVVGGVIVIAVLLLVIVFLWGRNSKK